MTFRIAWDVPEAEWETTTMLAREHFPGDRYDRDKGPLYIMLWGPVQFYADEQPLYPPELLLSMWEKTRALHMETGTSWFPLPEIADINGWDMSVADLAHRMVDIWDYLCVVKRSLKMNYRESNGPLRIAFTRQEDEVRISSWENHDLVVSVDEFCRGAHRFLTEVAAAIAQHLPELLEWETFVRFRQFLPSGNSAE